jgi:hypothetical protein
MLYITKGTFEDLIPLPIMVQALNKLYPTEGSVSDFNDEHDILDQMVKIIWTKSKSSLNKVKFIREAVRLMSEEDVPKLIRELVDDAYKLSDAK